MTSDTIKGGHQTRRLAVWGVLFVVNMALIAAARIFDVLDPLATWILILLNMGLLVPYTRAARARMEAKGAMSPALRRYNRRILTCGVIYMVAMIAGGNLYHAVAQASPLMWLIAMVPLAPVLGMIWTMARYLKEEDDEYLRHRAVNAALSGTALVLVAGTGWGFPETFGLVGHIWAWWVFPVFAIGLGVSMCWPRGDASEGR